MTERIETALRNLLSRATPETINAGIAALEGAKPARVPEGWKLVPVEPTTEMEAAGASCFGNHGNTPDGRYEVAVTYRAMLAAAPIPAELERLDRTEGEE